MRYDFITIIKLVAATFLPVVLSVALYLAEKKTRFDKVQYWKRQTIVGVLFGGVAVLGTEFGIPVGGAILNVRNAAPLTAGLLFGAPSGIIAGVIGGVYRFIATYWGAGEFSQVACTIGCILAGLFGAGCRKFMFDDKKPSWAYGLAIGGTTEVFHMFSVMEGYYLIATIPVSEAMFSRGIAISILAFMEVIVFAALFAHVYFLLKKLIVDNIHKINGSLAQITDGNLNVQVNVRENEEFASLSDDINATVDTLKRYIAEAESRIDRELEFARQIQHSALPSVFPPYPDRKDFDIFASIVGVLLDMLLFKNTNAYCGIIFTVIGLVFYLLSFIMAILVLKTEKKAQKRAYEIMKDEGLATKEELEMCKKLFRLYNIEYIIKSV